MSEKLTKAELGVLIPCSSCGKPTYKSTPETFGRELPEGMTVGNRRMKILFRGQRVTLCQNCRYSSPYDRY